MATDKNATIWTEKQQQYIRFLARGRKDTKGTKYSREEFAKLLGIDDATLYRWQALPGFKLAVFEQNLHDHVDKIPNLNNAIIGKAMGIKEFAKADVAAYQMVMRQFELLKVEKQEIKTEVHNVDSVLD